METYENFWVVVLIFTCSLPNAVYDQWWINDKDLLKCWLPTIYYRIGLPMFSLQQDKDLSMFSPLSWPIVEIVNLSLRSCWFDELTLLHWLSMALKKGTVFILIFWSNLANYWVILIIKQIICIFFNCID